MKDEIIVHMFMFWFYVGVMKIKDSDLDGSKSFLKSICTKLLTDFLFFFIVSPAKPPSSV